MALAVAEQRSTDEAAAALAGARLIVVKVGSSLLIDPATGVTRDAWLASVGEDIAALQAAGRHIVVVSSGAVALGRRVLGLKRSARLDLKQAAAAAGQSSLMRAWEAALAPHGIPTAQLLLTIDDSEQRRRWLNARATLEVLLVQNALPIVNENDSVATEELRYGDNDRLSARVAQMIRADLLILLSDVDGLYTADPAREPGAAHIARVDDVGEAIALHAGGAQAAGVGTGGMRTKLMAAGIARASGCATIIAHGHAPSPLKRIAEGSRATIVPAQGSPTSAYKQWIAATLAPAGQLVIDEGALAALKLGRSLLPAGVTGVEGTFQRGVCLSIEDGRRREVARGISAYASDEARSIAGCGSAALEERLGWRGPDEIVHRKDLVLL